MQTESSSHFIADEDEDEVSESESATLTSSHMAASSSSAPATHLSETATTNTLAHGYSTSRASISKTLDTTHSTLLSDALSRADVVRASSAAVVSSEIAEPTVTTTTVTSTIYRHRSSTATASRTPSSHSSSPFGASASTWKTARPSSHLPPTVSATPISPSAIGHPGSTTAQSSTIKQTSSHLFRGSTAATNIGSTASSSPTVGVIRTLPGAGSPGISAGAHQSPTASQSSHTSVHLTSGTIRNTHTSNTWTVHPTAAASHTTPISRSPTASRVSITHSPSTGIPITKGPTVPDVTGTVVSGTGIIIIIPGKSTSRNITIPLSPDDNIPSTGTVSMSTTSVPQVTTPAWATSQTTHAVSPHAPGLVTVHSTSTATKVVTVELPRPTTTTTSVAVPSERTATQATASKKAPAPVSDSPDNGSSLVVNPVSPMFLTVTETKTVTEKTVETRTTLMTVTTTAG
ncbi:hypothetical protein ANOM_007314 [Aspergillus nomiae NRRL 13137]|uniref:Uncharacterized protein n=1 Tax=Aspergillus nomiae NRRL (strain ATCC 15546 / NRRL 13137 / CBS 260.88 / M93) TaxID=1509407 RepID=A0A0L1IYT6_ASPN3|nr:uncharacterized protein ANOM_007314 [Aspergillus nomiae NRRL 13137]KNG84560.1 hypothetical protein ANOM_007314 [Aspergillus nomiae NRRL 13137]